MFKQRDIMTRNRLGNILKLVGVGVLTSFLMVGCDLFDVSNPDSLVEEDLEEPRAASSLKNGVVNAVMDATGWTYAVTHTITDEMFWQGSYESYRNLDRGQVTHEDNEEVIQSFPELAEARWLSDQAIERLHNFEDEGQLQSPGILTEAYIYSALARIIIGTHFEDFVYSDRMEAAPPIGMENMHQVFDEAIEHASEAAQRADQHGNAHLEKQALGLRAVAQHRLAIWEKLTPPGETPADPLVDNTGAVADAEAALALMDTDEELQHDYRGPTVYNHASSQVNGRAEVGLAEPFDDLKTGDADPRVVAFQDDFTDTGTYGDSYAPITWLSARQLRLIIAEEHIGSDDARARQEMNTIRAMDGLPEIEPGDDLVEFLEHERRANLFLQGTRLLDMYRFGTEAPNWSTEQDAMQRPGSRLPIPTNEIVTNPHL